MSGVKRSQLTDHGRGPNSAKKICIKDYFSPKPKPVEQVSTSNDNNPPKPKPIEQITLPRKSLSPKPKPFEQISSPENFFSPKTKPTDQIVASKDCLSSRPTSFVPAGSLKFYNSPKAKPFDESSPIRNFDSFKSKSQQVKRPLSDSTLSTMNNDKPIDDENHLHLTFEFLKPDKRRDIKKRRPSDPDYNERTLFVPESFLNNQTPALRQWWLIKQRNMDAVLFFKMGKFYELFYEDAVIGVNHLDINYMGKTDDTKPAHAGFPEVSYEKYSRMLIEKGFKVIRVEQTETPAMVDERCQSTGKKGKFDKVVSREVCRVTTKGTQMLGVFDSAFHLANNQFLLAIRESENQNSRNCKIFGVCFIDVTISKLYLGQFEDDHNYSGLNMLLSHYKPTEIIFERSNISKETHQSLLRSGALLSPLKGEREFWTVKKAFSYLKAHSIFLDQTGKFEWPEFLTNLFEGYHPSENVLSLEAKLEYSEGLHAFGAIVYYLDSQLIADQVLRCTNFNLYEQPLNTVSAQKSIDMKNSMILDHIALKNLEVFENSDGGSQATLYESINQCKTHFGQRLLRNWVCSPLCDITQINNRLDAVEALISNSNASLMNEIIHVLTPMPDLERLISRIKTQCFRSAADSRAIMFDGQQMSKAKIVSFMNILENLKIIRRFIESMSKTAENCKSETLRKLLSFTTSGGFFPDYEAELKYFDKAFDHAQASKTGKIIPASGVDSDYDKCSDDIDDINKQLNDYLEKQKEVLGCHSLKYYGNLKNRFQIEVPDAYTHKVPDHYRIETTRKGVKRYYTTHIDKLFQKLTLAEEEMKKVLDNIMSTIFAQFSEKMPLWLSAIECIALLDVLQSIATFVRSLMARNIDICRPEFKYSESPIIEYTNGRHPALVKSNPDFIANDLKLDQRLILLTGANMGGKSTIMRQTALLAVLAQLGCFVPASKMMLTPVDRIFSRLGASDRLLEGESTFYTELVETSTMLRYATKDSLLLLDELGRGTSTYDGTAIAYSVTNEIVNNLKSRCLFSTHYHCLVQDFGNNQRVRLAHMGCKVEKNVDNNDEVDIEPLKESITFLYKITDGPVARSYGFNVAKLAGIQDSIIAVAYKKSKELELSCTILEKLQKISHQRLENESSLDRDVLKDTVVREIEV